MATEIFCHRACNGCRSKKATELLAEMVTFSIRKLAPCVVEAFIVPSF